jgi:hypothetical protein
MSRLTTWISKQNPTAAKGMTALKDIDALHISTNPRLGTLVPRIGSRQTKTEDRTIPRICCSETVVGCIYGHSTVRDVSVEKEVFTGTEWQDLQCPVFYIYRLNVEELVRPSKKLVMDAVRTRELWVVPYAPEACAVKPERVGQLLLRKAVDVHDQGRHYQLNTFVMKVVKPIKLEDELLHPGHYQFDLHGSLSVVGGGTTSPVEKLKVISGAEFQTIVDNHAKT